MTISRRTDGDHWTSTTVSGSRAAASNGSKRGTERAATGPYGTTIAHGYLTLSLLPPLMADPIAIEDTSARINYGLTKTSPVPAGSRICGRARIVSVDEVPGGLTIVSPEQAVMASSM